MLGTVSEKQRERWTLSVDTQNLFYKVSLADFEKKDRYALSVDCTDNQITVKYKLCLKRLRFIFALCLLRVVGRTQYHAADRSCAPFSYLSVVHSKSISLRPEICVSFYYLECSRS